MTKYSLPNPPVSTVTGKVMVLLIHWNTKPISLMQKLL